MRPELVIFDCDGVLVDTEIVANTAISHNLARYGLDLSPNACVSLFLGGTLRVTMAKARSLGADLPDDWIDEMYSEMFTALEKGVAVIDGVGEVLVRLDALGIPDCVVSNGPPAKMRISLGPSGLWDRFEGRIWSPHTHGSAKPDPGLLLMAAKHFGVATEACVMIDDSPSGVIAAKRAGVRAIGFDDGGHSGRLKTLGVEVVHQISELEDKLLLG
ncbi:HAD family hydrolase [Pseudopelagicola sp. nBUS_20]|uniref:HAD family hydrolase n=1 Tax=Pseudopelagicola sp. nBUS_20 TaxID=3395317 RepID=UPI003EBAF575